MSMDSFCYSGGPNEIWSYGEEAYEILKKYVDIRESLRPYIYQNLKKASEDGTPIMRPLFMIIQMKRIMKFSINICLDRI